MNFVIHIYYYLLGINKIYYFQKKGLNTLIMIINNVQRTYLQGNFHFQKCFVDRSKKSDITLNQLQECQKYVWILKVRAAILATWKLLNNFGTQKSSNFISFGEVRRNFKRLQIYSQKITISFANNLLSIHRINVHSNLLISLLILLCIFLIFKHNY